MATSKIPMNYPIIKRKVVPEGTTDAYGIRLIMSRGSTIPLFAATNSPNQRVEFFHANNYWYVYAMSDTGAKLANTNIGFTLYYLENYSTIPD